MTAGSRPEPDPTPPSTRPRWTGLSRHVPRAVSWPPHQLRLRSLDVHRVQEIEGRKIESAVTQGFRRAHEDAFLVESFRPTPGEEVGVALREAFARTDALTRDHKSGSTCTVAVIGADHDLVLAHVGDSPALLFVVDGESGEVYFKSLLREHNTLDAEEKNRVLQCWGEESDRSAQAQPPGGDERKAGAGAHEVARAGRIVLPSGSSLAVSRAFGDQRFGWALSREPDITRISLHQWLPNLGPRDRVFLCLASDGLIETPWRGSDRALRELSDAVGESVARNDCRTLAESLVQQAYRQSTDNITALVTEIDHSGPPAGGAVVMCVADGHGGADTAQTVIASMRECLGGAKLPPQKSADAGGREAGSVESTAAKINWLRISKRWFQGGPGV